MSDPGLTLLGGFRLQTDSGEAVPLRQKRVQALLAFLAMYPGQEQGRYKLASLLWSRSDDEHARQSLRQTIRALRKSSLLVNHAGLIVTPDAITMADDAFTIDAADFKRLAAEDSVASLEEALALYQGDFLEGLDLNEPAFEDWLSETRRELSDTALQTMLKLLDAYESDGAVEDGLRVARRILTVDQFRETAHRAVMRCLDRLGRRTEAIQHYKACSETLKTELGVEPAGATAALYREILKSSGDGQVEDGTIYGDGVKVEAAFEDIGAHKVKNIAKPIRTYRVLTDGPAAAIPSSASTISSKRNGLIAAAAVAVLAIGGVAIWQETKLPPAAPIADAHRRRHFDG